MWLAEKVLGTLKWVEGEGENGHAEEICRLIIVAPLPLLDVRGVVLLPEGVLCKEILHMTPNGIDWLRMHRQNLGFSPCLNLDLAHKFTV